MIHDQDDSVLPEDGDLSSSLQDDEEEDDVLDEEEDDDDVINLNSATSNSNSNSHHHSLPIAVAAAVTVASLPAAPMSVASISPTTAVIDGAADSKRPRTVQYDPEVLLLPTAAEEKKPVAALDDSRRLFQRLWTDEDEIELLQGFLDYTTQRGNRGGGGGQNDTALFYDQIKSKLQLEFNKNQLVEKLRRLKKKYRNVLNKIAAGKDVSFKSPHEQATFDISRKIWSNIGRVPDALDDEEQPNPNPNHSNFNLNSFEIKTEDSAGGFQKSTSRSRKRSRPQSTPPKPPPGFIEPPAAVAATITTVIKENHHSISNGGGGGNNSSGGGNCNVQGLIEETVKSCLSPLFKELVSNAMGGGGGGGQQSRAFGGLLLNPIPLSFGGPSMNLNFGFGGGEAVEEQWRNQQILELEVYSKRLELVQNQIKVALDELRSSNGGR